MLNAAQGSSLFQFHKGTIKTVLYLVLSLFLVPFNSIKVQLRRSTVHNLFHKICFQFHKGTIKTKAE